MAHRLGIDLGTTNTVASVAAERAPVQLVSGHAPMASYPSPAPSPSGFPPGPGGQGAPPGARPPGYQAGPPPTQPYGASGPGQGGPPPPGPTGDGSGPAGSRGRLILIIAAAVVLLGAAVSAGVLIVRSGKPGSHASPSASASASAGSTLQSPSGTASASPSGSPSGSRSATPSSSIQDLPRSAAVPGNVILVPMRRAAGAERPLFLVDSEGTTDPVQLPTPPGDTTNALMQASRDTIIYLRNGVLRVMAADGSGDRRLFTNEPAGCSKVAQATWSLADPNVMVISCEVSADKFGLFVIGMDGRLIRQLHTGMSIIGDFSLSSDGQTVAYWASNNPNRDGGSIFTLPIIGTGAPKQLTNSADGVDANPAWSPDGTQIAFRRRIPNGTDAGNLDVYVMDADGSGLRAIATTPAQDLKPIWSPDNKNLVIISNRRSAFGGPGKTFDLWLIRVSDKEVLASLGLKANQINRPFWTLR